MVTTSQNVWLTRLIHNLTDRSVQTATICQDTITRCVYLLHSLYKFRFHFTCPSVCTCYWLHSKKNSCQQMSKVFLLWQIGLVANIRLHFYFWICIFYFYFSIALLCDLCLFIRGCNYFWLLAALVTALMLDQIS